MMIWRETKLPNPVHVPTKIVKAWLEVAYSLVAWPPLARGFCVAAYLLSVILPLELFISPACGQALPVAIQGREPSLLVPNQSVQGEIGQDESHIYSITLKAGQYLSATIDLTSFDVNIALWSPRGQKLRELDSRYSGLKLVSAIVPTSGTYLFVVRALEMDVVPGAYRLKIERLRQATAQDQRRVIAEKAFAEAERLCETWEAKARRSAITKYQLALAHWQQVGDQQQVVGVLRNIGEVYSSLSELQTALRYYDLALSQDTGRNNEKSKSDTLNQSSNIYFYLGKHQKALECATQALGLSRAADYKLGEIYALNNVGESHYWLGENQQSLDFYEQALALCRILNERRPLAHTLLNLGYTHTALGNMQEAFDYYKRALTLWRSTGHRRGEALTLTAIGQLYSRIGEKQEALNFFTQGTKLFRLMGDRLWEATNSSSSAYSYLGLGELQRALSNYENALRLWREVNYNQGVAFSLLYIGEVHYTQGNYRQALDYYQQALPILRDFKLRRAESYALRYIGRTYAALGEQRKALEYYHSALPLYRIGGDRQGEAYLLNDLGDTQRMLNEQEQALEYYRQALGLNQTVGDRFGESQTHYHLALLELDQKNLTAACAQIEAALNLSESLRAKVISQELRTSYSASIHQYYKLQMDVLMSLHRQQPALGYDALALAASEKARARSLLELLAEARADLRQGVEPELLERERMLRQQLNGKAERLMRLRGGTPKEAELMAATQEVDTLAAQYDDVRAQIRARSPHYAALTQPQPLDLAAIQASVLDDDTALLEYALGEQRSYVWAVTKQGIASYELAPRAQIEQSSRRFYDLLIARQPVAGETLKQRRGRLAESDAQYALVAAELSRLVLAPVAAQLGNRRLLIVSEGALQYVPFAALPSPVQAGQPLIVEHEIVSLPSASTLAVLRNETSLREPAPKGVVALADPVFGKDDARFSAGIRARAAAGQRGTKAAATADADLALPRLPETRDEAEAILAVAPAGAARLVHGFAVNRALVTGPELSQYRIIHLATHGLLDSQHPALSGVALSRFDPRGQSQDGFLRLHDIYNLKLPAELIVLSACNTALGQDVKGEGLIALTRGFMYAGAARVLASLWKVDDEATAELMKEFYQRLLQTRCSPAAALREAQLAMWRQGRAPYHWAAFVLQGEYLGAKLNLRQ